MSKDHTITITFNDPNNKPLIESNDFNMPKDDKVNGLPIGAQGFMLSMDFRNTKQAFFGLKKLKTACFLLSILL